MSKRRGKMEALAKVIDTTRCARCGEDADVTDIGHDTWVTFNRVLKKRGQRPLKYNQIALCPDCYERWQAYQRQQSAEQYQREIGARADFKQALENDGASFAFESVPNEFRRDFGFKEWAGRYLDHWRQQQRKGKRKAAAF